MKSLFLKSLLGLGLAVSAQAQTLSPWEMNKGEDIIKLPVGKTSRNLKTGERLPMVYEYAKMPAKNAAGWTLVPTTDGKVSFAEKSILDNANYGKHIEIDITYFRAYIDVPKGFSVNQASVTIGEVDDQARMLLINSKHPKGFAVEANDGKRGGKQVSTDFTKDIVSGEINTFVIYQVDDNCCGNNLKGGITVSLNNKSIAPVTKEVFATKFPDFVKNTVYADLTNLRAYSINGGNYSDAQPFGVTIVDNVCVIRSFNELNQNTGYLNIEKVSAGAASNGKPLFAFKVTNSAPNTYLTLSGTGAQDNRITTKVYSSLPPEVKYYEVSSLNNDPAHAGFKSYESFSHPGSYLRHQGRFLEIDPLLDQDMYRKDASWRLEKLK